MSDVYVGIHIDIPQCYHVIEGRILVSAWDGPSGRVANSLDNEVREAMAKHGGLLTIDVRVDTDTGGFSSEQRWTELTVNLNNVLSVRKIPGWVDETEVKDATAVKAEILYPDARNG